MTGIPETIKVSDGKGGFSTINKSDFKAGVHEVYEVTEVNASVVESAEIFSESEEEEEEVKEEEEFDEDDPANDE